MMSQVMVCARQAVCSWGGGGGGFHHRPIFVDIVEACEHLGRDRKKTQSGVNIFFFSNKLLHLYFRLKHSTSKMCSCKCYPHKK